MIRIVAPHFVAGVVLDKRDKVERVAPIVSYMRGWQLSRVIEYCRQRNWQCEVIHVR